MYLIPESLNVKHFIAFANDALLERDFVLRTRNVIWDDGGKERVMGGGTVPDQKRDEVHFW